MFQAILDLMKEEWEDMEEFFWGHLRKDVVCLAEALSRNTQDAMLPVPLFLQHLRWNNPAGRVMLGSSGKSPTGLRSLGFNRDRCHWFLLPGTVSMPGNQ